MVEVVVRWYLQGNHHLMGFLGGAGFRASAVVLAVRTAKLTLKGAFCYCSLHVVPNRE